MKRSIPILLAGIIATSSLWAQTPNDGAKQAPPDPFVRGNEEAEQDDRGPRQISIRFEVFSVDIDEAAALSRKELSDEALYGQLIQGLAKGTVTQEQLAVIRARSGERASLENAADGTPADGDSPQPKSAPGAEPATPPNRKAGLTLQVEPTADMTYQIIDLAILAKVTSVAKAPSTGELVNFTQKFSTAATLKSGGAPMLLATPSRPDEGLAGYERPRRVWFAFVMATVIKA